MGRDEHMGERVDNDDDARAQSALVSVPDEFWTTPELAHVKQAADSRYLNPIAVLGALLACLAAEVNPRVRTPAVAGEPGSMNLIVAACGQSGTGKSQAMRLAEDLMGHVRASIEEPSSGEGLIAAYRALERDQSPQAPEGAKREVWRTRGVLAFTDEVSTSAGVGSRQGNTLISRLRSLVTGAYVGTANATPERNRRLPANGYAFGYVIGVQPGNADVLVGSEAVTTGLTGRLLAVPTTLGEPAHGVADPGSLHIDWPDGVRLDPVRDRSEHTQDRPCGRIVMTAHDCVAEEVLPAILASKQGRRSPEEGHQAYVRIKVASLLAILHGRTHVTQDDWERSGMIMGVSGHTLAWMKSEEARRHRRHAQARGLRDAEQEDARDAARVTRTATRCRAIAAVHAEDPVDCKGRARHDGCTVACFSTRLSQAARGDALQSALEYVLEKDLLSLHFESDGSSRDGAEVRIYRPGASGG